MAHNLRIVLSMLFAIVTVAICAMWVRSYTYSDSVKLKILPSGFMFLHTGDARMVVWFERQPTFIRFAWQSDRIVTHATPKSANRIPPFEMHVGQAFVRFYLAHWVLAVTAAVFAVIPWCHRRFSMRTFLVAITTVGFVAAMIGWVDRTF